jgi:SWIM zinc finger
MKLRRYQTVQPLIQRQCQFQVRVDKDNNEVICNCQGFEFEGLLCSHSLKAMQNLGTRLHPRYVLLRWTKEANQGVKRYFDDMRSVEALQSDAHRYDNLF